MADMEARGGTLVLGGGFAGSYVARYLGKRGATIISPENYMLFTPMFPEAASGTLEPRHVVVPLRMMCPHAELLLGEARAHDVAGQRIQVEAGGRVFWMRYSNLVVAIGAVVRTLPIPGVANIMGIHFKGFLGWWITRTYHLYQLPLFSRKLRVVTDWTVALFFRRDIAQLGTLGHPDRLDG